MLLAQAEALHLFDLLLSLRLNESRLLLLRSRLAHLPLRGRLLFRAECAFLRELFLKLFALLAPDGSALPEIAPLALLHCLVVRAHLVLVDVLVHLLDVDVCYLLVKLLSARLQQVDLLLLLRKGKC